MKTHILTLTQMRFFGRHGVYPQETAIGQPFEATVSLELPAHGADELQATTDYCAVQKAVRSILEGPPRKLVETLAEEVAAALLHAFPAALAVEVEIIKPNPPVDFEFKGFSVRLKRKREG